jgi:hypothetical protein
MSTAEKNKGGQKLWATSEQKDWLTSRLPAFLASRNSSAAADFWPTLFEDWFEKWPVAQVDGEGALDGSSEVQTIREDLIRKKKAVSDVHRTFRIHLRNLYT